MFIFDPTTGLMNFGICNLGVVPVRKEPSDKAEMTTQLLFGELMVVQYIEKGWAWIRLVNDGYEGWIDQKQLKSLDEGEFNGLSDGATQYCADLVQLVTHRPTGAMIPIVAGSALTGMKNGIFRIAGEDYWFEGTACMPDVRLSRKTILSNAMLYLNAPYQWGGRSPFGIDCSGFIQMVFLMAGVKLLRDACQQATQGETLSFLTDAWPGDLVFFDNEEGKIVHVGLLTGNNKVMHASGRVRMDDIDHEGIFNKDLNKYSHRLRIIKRIL